MIGFKLVIWLIHCNMISSVWYHLQTTSFFLHNVACCIHSVFHFIDLCTDELFEWQKISRSTVVMLMLTKGLATCTVLHSWEFFEFQCFGLVVWIWPTVCHSWWLYTKTHLEVLRMHHVDYNRNTRVCTLRRAFTVCWAISSVKSLRI